MADTLIKHLSALLGPEQVLSEAAELLVYECDGLTHYKHRPRAVVFPRSTEEVSEVLRLLARERVPFVPRGAGTGLSGGALAVGGGVCVELARMRRLLKVDVENCLAVVEVGMVNAQLSRAVARYGLHYVPDPSSQISCTIGGNVAENVAGSLSEVRHDRRSTCWACALSSRTGEWSSWAARARHQSGTTCRSLRRLRGTFGIARRPPCA